MSDSQVSVGAALGYAWSLWRSHWREIWGALALNALAWTVLYAGSFAQDLRLTAAAAVAMLFTVYSVYGAIIRLAFAAEHPDDPRFRVGTMGLQWRGMELRMFGASALWLVFILILLLLLSIAVAAPVMGTMLSQGGLPAAPPKPLAAPMTLADMTKTFGPTGGMIMQVGLLVSELVLAFVVTRLSLYLVATGESGRISVLRTWKLTRGHFWQVFATSLVIGLPTVLIMSVGAGAGLPLNGQPAPLAPGEIFLYSLVCGGWAGAAAMPLSAGVQAYFYRNLKTDV
jgi:hypothetical protein